jgi:uncharacterized protein (DUF885 family)
MLPPKQNHSRINRRSILAASAAAGALVTGLSLSPSTARALSRYAKKLPHSTRLKRILAALAVAMLRESPERATALAVSDRQAGGRYADRLDDRSAAGMGRRAAVFSRTLTEISTIDRALLSHSDAISFDVVKEAMTNALAGARFGWGKYGFDAPRPYVVDQLNSAHITVPAFLDAQQPIKSPDDIDCFLTRLSAFADVLDQETVRIRADADIGIVPPGFVLDRTLAQLKALAAGSPMESGLVASLQRRLPSVEGLSASDVNKLLAQAGAIISGKVAPAYQRQSDALAALRPAASDDAGLWRLKDGGAFYATALRAWTTSALSPGEIHAMGHDLLAGLNAEMAAALTAQGLTRGSIGERLARLTADPAQLYPNTDAGRLELVAHLNQLIAKLQPRLPRYFGVLAKTKLDIKRVPLLNESGSSGGYYEAGALDGSRPGIYYINLRDTAEWPRFLLSTLTYHEGEPGHHWQISIAQEAAALPFVRKALLELTGYIEGWGLYAEDLADEMGAYADDPLGRIGYLQFAMFRAARLVVDTGIHAKRWSKQQAAKFMIENTGRHPNTVNTEIERYTVQPGQACAYMIGRETIRALRNEARAMLGQRFDIRLFHDQILQNGAMPLSVLSAVIKSWSAGEAGEAPGIK